MSISIPRLDKQASAMISGVWKRLVSNRVGLYFTSAAIGVVMLSLAMQGCMLADVMKHSVPASMQGYNDGEPKVTLRESAYLRERYVADVERNLRQYDNSAADSFMLMDIFSSTLTLGIEAIGQSPLPGGAMISGGLLALAGLFTRKPGTDKEIQGEKIKSYNAADQQWRDTLKELMSPEMMAQALGLMSQKKDGESA